MECNKDEAVRAKSIAEAKLGKKDFLGAKKFAIKAQALYPTLDGVSRMLTTLEVYISAEKKINGAVDWYGVLGVGPTADDETIKKQYRKLALVLHPDKNNSAGADDAFKLISEAWTLLSDKAKRLAYNQTMGLKVFEPKAPTHTGGPAAAHTRGPTPSTYTDGPCARNGGPSAYNGPSAHTGGPSANTGGATAYNHSGGPPRPSSDGPFSKFSNRKPPASKFQKKKSAKAAVPSKRSPLPSDQGTNTFWTVCSHCQVQYEYQNFYLNTTLLCPTCKKGFNALEIPRPITKSRPQKPNPGPAQPPKSNNNNLSTPPSADDRGKNVASDAQKSGAGPLRAPPSADDRGKNVASDAQKSGAGPFRTPPSANDRGKNVASDASGAGQAGLNTFMRADPHFASSSVDCADIEANIAAFGHQLKRAACPELKNGSFGVDGFSKKRKLDKGHKNHNKMPQQNVNFGTASTVHEAVVMRKLLLENARKEASRKMNELRSEGPAVKPKVNCMTEERERINGNGQKCCKNAGNDSPADDSGKQKDEIKERDGKINKNGKKCPKKLNDNPSADNTREEISGMIMNVPDPDFYNFDLDRTEDSFSDNEVWAAYDDDDGMPRFYAMIQKVISKDPFKLKISWLNSKTTVEFGRLDWIGSGFYKTCGEFWVGKHEICKFVNAFSQRVKWSKGPRGSVVILPRKGDVWALYRNWSSEWDTSTPDDVIRKYDMVIVLDDYNEDKGVSVSQLAKVVGYRTVFRPNMGKEGIMEIPKEEMFRFSHLVPYHGLESREAPDAPKGCMELDPAATPLELLQMETKDGNANGADIGKGKMMETVTVPCF